MAKPKIALYWAASCGGCDVAVFETNRNTWTSPTWRILCSGLSPLISNATILKRCRMALLTCACFGGVPTLADFTNSAEIFQRAYVEAPSNVNPEGTFPQVRTKVTEGELELPEFFDPSVGNLSGSILKMYNYGSTTASGKITPSSSLA